MKVPTNIKETPRSAAEGLYVFPREKSFPIGDLFHARLALIYALSPSHSSVRSEVLSAVEDAYPQYDWASWWNNKTKRKRGVLKWSQYTSQQLPMAANPKSMEARMPRRKNPHTVEWVVVAPKRKLKELNLLCEELLAMGLGTDYVIRSTKEGRSHAFAVKFEDIPTYSRVNSRAPNTTLIAAHLATIGHVVGNTTYNVIRNPAEDLKALRKEFRDQYGVNWWQDDKIKAKFNERKAELDSTKAREQKREEEKKARAAAKPKKGKGKGKGRTSPASQSINFQQLMAQRQQAPTRPSGQQQQQDDDGLVQLLVQIGRRQFLPIYVEAEDVEMALDTLSDAGLMVRSN